MPRSSVSGWIRTRRPQPASSVRQRAAAASEMDSNCEVMCGPALWSRSLRQSGFSRIGGRPPAGCLNATARGARQLSVDVGVVRGRRQGHRPSEKPPIRRRSWRPGLWGAGGRFPDHWSCCRRAGPCRSPRAGAKAPARCLAEIWASIAALPCGCGARLHRPAHRHRQVEDCRRSAPRRSCGYGAAWARRMGPMGDAIAAPR